MLIDWFAFAWFFRNSCLSFVCCCLGFEILLDCLIVWLMFGFAVSSLVVVGCLAFCFV